jgi:hypothetical protein
MRHAPANGSFLEVARDKQLRFVRIAGFLPGAFPVWIAPGEQFFDGVERRYRMVRMTAGKAG